LISIEEFFFEDPAISPENPWKPLLKHSLEQSPCYPIIGMHNKYKVLFYYCKLHSNIENIYLESIEHHCKFSNPEFHKLELLKLLKEIKRYSSSLRKQQGSKRLDICKSLSIPIYYEMHKADSHIL
jgi:hypothetical protein